MLKEEVDLMKIYLLSRTVEVSVVVFRMILIVLHVNCMARLTLRVINFSEISACQSNFMKITVSVLEKIERIKVIQKMKKVRNIKQFF